MILSERTYRKKKDKKIILGDDAIKSVEFDWFTFKNPATELANMLYKISEYSGVCCGVIGPWGSGKSSFMRLMQEYISNESDWENVTVAWFTAWDPGGIEDLGDAMLYYFYKTFVEKHNELNHNYNELKNALGIRRSLKKRAGRMLRDISDALPTPRGVIPAVASSLFEELAS